MKIAFITAGAGAMYCGSCLRDNALAAALMARGHEVHLIPTYTPTRTDEPNISEGRIFLGGINVYLQQHFGIFRKTPWILDRLWDLKPILKLATHWSLRVDPAHLGDMTVSMLRGDEGFQRKEIQKLVRFIQAEISPDIVTLPNCLLSGLAPELKARMRSPICCTLQGEDLFLEGLPERYRKESFHLIRSNSVYVDAFLAVSEYYAGAMSEYLGIERKKIHVVPLGINVNGHRARNGIPLNPFTIGYMARIAPEKGLHILCEAYHRIRQKKDGAPSRLLAAGYLAPEHRDYLRDIQRKIAAWGLSDEFEYLGELSRTEKIEFLQSLSVLSVPCSYQEPKGFYVLEAMANGVPVVQPRKGAFPEIIAATGGGILADDDPGALAEGILHLWENPEKMAELGRRGSEGVRLHFSAERMAERAEGIYRKIIRESVGKIGEAARAKNA